MSHQLFMNAYGVFSAICENKSYKIDKDIHCSAEKALCYADNQMNKIQRIFNKMVWESNLLKYIRQFQFEINTPFVVRWFLMVHVISSNHFRKIL